MKNEEIIIQTEDVKVRIIELQSGEHGPFHFHTEITDNMFGISGEVIVSMKNPPGRVHCVSNNLKNETSKYLLVQGVGKYDFIMEDD